MKICTISNILLEKKDPSAHYFVIILNSELQKHIINKLFQIADYVICGDGGSNRLFNILSEEERSINKK